MAAGGPFTIWWLPQVKVMILLTLIHSYALSYCSVDDTFALVNLLGPGILLSKIDLKNAFCIIPVRQADWYLLGKESITLTHAYLLACAPPPASLIT